jgi:hypothetical protein
MKKLKKSGEMRNIFSYVIKKYTNELNSNSYVEPKFY